MQTFLPVPDFTLSAKLLDRKRLGKQRVEAKQIYLALTKKDYGWKNHPATLMWKGCERKLLEYGIAMAKEWRERGYEDKTLEFFENQLKKRYFRKVTPWWFSHDALYASHRANLKRKNYHHYKMFVEDPAMEYVWPTKI